MENCSLEFIILLQTGGRWSEERKYSTKVELILLFENELHSTMMNFCSLKARVAKNRFSETMWNDGRKKRSLLLGNRKL
jgi:hypothetical protein